MNDTIQSKIRALPIRQQIGLWVLLRFADAQNDDFSFHSSEFAEVFQKFLPEKVKKNALDFGRSIGGILSGLSRNGLLTKLSGDRDVLWTFSNEIKKQFEDYKKYLFEMKRYWSNI